MNTFQVVLCCVLSGVFFILGRYSNKFIAIFQKKIPKKSTTEFSNDRILHSFEKEMAQFPDQLKNYLGLSKFGIWQYELQTGRLKISQTLSEILGYNPSDTVTLEDFLRMLNSSNDLQSLVYIFDKASISNQEYETTVELKTKFDKVIFLKIKIAKGISPRGLAILMGNVQQLELSQSDLDLRENFKVLAENTSDGIYILENDYLIFVSERLKSDFEDGFFDAIKLRTEDLFQFVHPDDVVRVMDVTQRAEAKKLLRYKLNYRLLSQKRGTVYKEDTIHYLLDRSGEIYRTIIISKDVTELRQAKKNINVEALFNLDLVDNFPGFLLVKNYNGKYIFGNRKAADVLGVSQDQIYGLDDQAYTSDKSMILKYLEDDQKVIDSGKAMVISKEKGIRLSREEGYFQTIKIPVEIEGEEKPCVLIFAFDITEKANQESIEFQRKNTIAYQNKVLLGLIEQDFNSRNFFENCLRITEAVSRGLKVDFASIWQVNNNELICLDFYKASDDTHQKLHKYETSVWKPYLDLFTDQLELVVTDTENESSAFLPQVSKEYYLDNSIRATLDIPLKLGDEFRGILCCESSSVKNWSAEDIAFAKYLGNLILTLWEQDFRHEAERLLLEKNEILRISAEVSQLLQQTADFERSLPTMLSKIGGAIGLSRVYYFVNNFEKKSFCQIGEWVNIGIKSEMDNPILQDLKYDKLGRYYGELADGRPIQFVISDISDAEHYERLKAQNILSQLVIPVMSQGVLLGYIGFDDCESERVWSQNYVNSFLGIGASIGSALEKLNSERAKQESQQNFKQISDALEEVFWLFDIDQSRFLLISKACYNVFGVSEEEGYKDFQFIEKLILEEDFSKILERKAGFSEGVLKDINYKIKTPGGQLRVINEKISPIYDANSKLVRISGIARDVTQKVEAQNEIQRLSVVAQNISNGVLIADLDGKALWANHAYLTLFEIEMVDLVGKKPSEIFLTESLESVLDKTNLNSRGKVVEFKVKTFKGNWIWVELNSTVIRDPSGKPNQIIEIVNNISERKRNELTLKENESRLRFITENTSDGFLIFRDLELTYCSVQCEKMFGYNWHEIQSYDTLNIFELIHTDDLDVLNGFMRKLALRKNENSYFQVRVMHKQGHFIWTEVGVKVVLNDHNYPSSAVVVVRNIESRKQMEDALRDNYYKLQNILNSLDEVVWAVEYPSLRPLFISESIKELYGVSSQEWRKVSNDLMSYTIEEDKLILKRMARKLDKEGHAEGEFRMLDKNGVVKWISSSSKIVEDILLKTKMVIGVLSDITKVKISEMETQQARKETEIAQNAYSELELRALQMQMNPHFIFNALNSIQSYIMNKEEQMANVYLTKFAALIRQFLDSSRSKYISLEEEITHLKLYIELEKLRFENKFEYHFEIDPAINKYSEIPTMLLQPFIENAINHGLRYKEKSGFLKVSFIDNPTDILVKIEDNGVGRDAAEKIKALSSQGYKSQGLKITTQRIENYNKLNLENIKFKISDLIENSENIGTLVEIYFPKNE